MELDTESELGDHGVRKVDYELGRFTTIDLVAEFLLAPYSTKKRRLISKPPCLVYVFTE